MASPLKNSDVVTWPSVLRAPSLKQQVQATKVLCVGAGGIGCELLKTLVCTGFQAIEVIDLDTIEISNLNRQFLFRKHHVGQSKASTAAEVVRTFQPVARITAHHANVKEPRFDVDFFRGFDIVLNGLDNLEARRHVNRLCLAAERPLIESGTAGHLGQVTVHLKGRTQCFECDPKPVPKSFPICTLRNTPDRPIHCIVWAKDLLFSRLFGKQEDASDLDAVPEQPGEAAAPAAARGNVTAAAASTAPIVQEPAEQEGPSPFARREGESSLQYAARVFERVYRADIERLARVEDLWTKRSPPKPLHLKELLPDLSELAGATHQGLTSVSRALGLNNPNEKWSLRDNARVFVASIAAYHEARAKVMGSAVFDKDDDLAVDFVTAASNLRSLCYGIPTQSLFDAKGMAGNIIHAIATTNAIIAGLIVVEALKVVAGLHAACRDNFLVEEPSRRRAGDAGRLLSAIVPQPPKASCMVCSRAQVTLQVDTTTMPLQTLISQVLKKRLAMSSPTLMCGTFLYEEGEGLEEDEVEAYQAMLPVTLESLPGGGLRHGSILNVQDQTQHFSVDIILEHKANFDEEKEPEGFVLSGTTPMAGEDPQTAGEAGVPDPPTANTPVAPTSKDDNTDPVILDEHEVPDLGGLAGEAPGTKDDRGGNKRARGEEAAAQEDPTAKKARGPEEADGVAAALSDDNNDVIVLD